MKNSSGSEAKAPDRKQTAKATTKTRTGSQAATTKKKAEPKAKAKSRTTTTTAKAPTATAGTAPQRSAAPVRLSVDAVMTPNPHACRPETDLAEAALTMWSGDFGALPVLDADDRVVGMITDRDICMALAVSGRRANERTVGEIMAGPVVRCHAADDTHDVLAAMAEHRVRRLPVTDEGGRLRGMVSLADLVRARTPALPDDDVVDTLRDILRPHGEGRAKGGTGR